MKRSFGTVRQLPSGRWQVRLRPNPGAAQAPLPETFEDKKLAEKALAKAWDELDRGVHVHPKASQVILEDFWLDYSVTKTDWAPTTRQDRESLWRLHVAPTFGQLALRDITPSRVRSWYAALHKEHVAAATGAYRLLRQVLNAAIEDGRLVTNACRIPGAGTDEAPERHIATLAELETMTAAMPERLRLLVLLATWGGLRRSELLGLRRGDLDIIHRTVTMGQTVHHLRDGQVVTGRGKSRAARRTVAFPSSLVTDVEDHLARFVEADRSALVFTGEKGGPLRPHVLGKAFRQARSAAGREDLTLHDLRHTADTLAATTGATLPELMHRMGHATPHSALRYLHATADRDRVIAEALAELRPPAPVIDISTKEAR